MCCNFFGVGDKEKQETKRKHLFALGHFSTRKCRVHVPFGTICTCVQVGHNFALTGAQVVLYYFFPGPSFFSQQQQKFMARDRSKSSSMCSAMLLASLPQKKLRLLFLLFPSSAFLLVHCNRQNRFPLFPFSSLLQKHSNVFSFHFFLSSPPDSSDCSACVGAAAAARASTPLSW